MEVNLTVMFAKILRKEVKKTKAIKAKRFFKNAKLIDKRKLFKVY